MLKTDVSNAEKNSISVSSGQSGAVGEYLSGKIKFLSALSMVFVVFIHAYNYTDTFLQPMTCITEGMHGGDDAVFPFQCVFA